MTRTRFLLIILILLVGCTDDAVQPPPEIDPFADCGNSDPISSQDSVLIGRPQPRFRISLLRVSPYNGWWAGEYEGYPWASGQYSQGIFVYDPINDKPVARYDGAGFHYWSPDGRKLMISTFSAIYVIDIPSMEINNITAEGIGDLGSWSLDGNTIYARYGSNTEPGGLYSMKQDGTDKTFITSKIWLAKLLDKNRFFSVYQDSIRIYNIQKDELSKIYKPEMDSYHNPSVTDFSTDRDFILFETWENGNIYDPWGNGIWLMDSETWTPRKILGAQWWSHEYYPTWASNSTFYASVFCRKDSASMVWEFDLNGNPIRQITTKEMNVWME